MALWHCRECTTAYAVGLPACPHCRSTHYVEDGMPKITRHGGVSNAGAAAEAVDANEEGTEVPSSAGSSSSTSPQKPATSQKTSGRDRHKRARTTASHSKQDRTADSTASSTASSGPNTHGSDDSSTEN